MKLFKLHLLISAALGVKAQLPPLPPPVLPPLPGPVDSPPAPAPQVPIPTPDRPPESVPAPAPVAAPNQSPVAVQPIPAIPPKKIRPTDIEKDQLKLSNFDVGRGSLTRKFKRVRG